MLATRGCHLGAGSFSPLFDHGADLNVYHSLLPCLTCERRHAWCDRRMTALSDDTRYWNCTSEHQTFHIQEEMQVLSCMNGVLKYSLANLGGFVGSTVSLPDVAYSGISPRYIVTSTELLD